MESRKQYKYDLQQSYNAEFTKFSLYYCHDHDLVEKIHNELFKLYDNFLALDVLSTLSRFKVEVPAVLGQVIEAANDADKLKHIYFNIVNTYYQLASRLLREITTLDPNKLMHGMFLDAVGQYDADYYVLVKDGINNTDAIAKLTEGVFATIHLKIGSGNEDVDRAIRVSKSMPGFSSSLKKSAGTLIALACVVAIIGLAVAPLTFGVSGLIGVIALQYAAASFTSLALMTGAGVALRYSGREKNSAKQLSRLSVTVKNKCEAPKEALSDSQSVSKAETPVP
jgi:hypothetical protein